MKLPNDIPNYLIIYQMVMQLAGQLQLHIPSHMKIYQIISPTNWEVINLYNTKVMKLYFQLHQKLPIDIPPNCGFIYNIIINN